jgi:hypothetical protein
MKTSDVERAVFCILASISAMITACAIYFLVAKVMHDYFMSAMSKTSARPVFPVPFIVVHWADYLLMLPFSFFSQWWAFSGIRAEKLRLLVRLGVLALAVLLLWVVRDLAVIEGDYE